MKLLFVLGIVCLFSCAGGSNNLTSYSERPSWSPDGKQIVFNSNRDGDDEIYVIRVDGSGLRQLTNNDDDDYTPFWSPDGDFISFGSNRDGNSEIYVMKADGSEQKR
ncbi:MAG: biopolymer transporter TolR, partial [Cyclobacteriaceae bacterium]